MGPTSDGAGPLSHFGRQSSPRSGFLQARLDTTDRRDQFFGVSLGDGHPHTTLPASPDAKKTQDRSAKGSGHQSRRPVSKNQTTEKAREQQKSSELQLFTPSYSISIVPKPNRLHHSDVEGGRQGNAGGDSRQCTSNEAGSPGMPMLAKNPGLEVVGAGFSPSRPPEASRFTKD